MKRILSLVDATITSHVYMFVVMTILIISSFPIEMGVPTLMHLSRILFVLVLNGMCMQQVCS